MDQVRTGLGIFAVVIVTIIFVQTVVRIYKNFQAGLTTADTGVELPTPDFAFGAMPKINFPVQENNVKPKSYQLAVAGVNQENNVGWPNFGEMSSLITKEDGRLYMINVYKLNPINFSLTAEQKARNIAVNLDFPNDPKILDDQTYLFSYPGPPLKESLEVNLKTMFVTLLTDYLSVDNVFALTQASGDKYIPDRVSAIEAVRNFLATAGILPDDLSDGAATVEYARSVGSKLKPVTSVLEAEFMTVNLPREGLAGLVNGEPTTYNFYGPDNVSSIYAAVGRAYNKDTAKSQDVVVQLNDYYYPLDTGEKGTYYLRNAASAWESLQAGNAYVVNPYQVETAVINRVELGYYESHTEQEFLLPIYVFYGENGFMAYVQALHPSMIAN